MKKFRKNFFKEAKLHKCCGDNDLRPALNYIHFKNGYAYSTDGYIAVKYNVLQISENFTEEEVKNLDGKRIHKKAYELLLKFDTVSIIETGFLCSNFNQPFLSTTISFDIVDYKFPDVDIILEQKLKDLKPLARIGISSSLLIKLSNSLPYRNGFIFFFSNESDAIICKSDMYEELNDCIAILMPFSIPDEIKL